MGKKQELVFSIQDLGDDNHNENSFSKNALEIVIKIVLFKFTLLLGWHRTEVITKYVTQVTSGRCESHNLFFMFLAELMSGVWNSTALFFVLRIKGRSNTVEKN